MAQQILPSRRGSGGFTLLEIMIVIALVGLMSALVIGGATALLREGPATAEESLRNAIAQSRREAVLGMHEVRLSFDAKGRAFLASWEGGERRIPVGVEGELLVEFLGVASDTAMLLGGNLVETGSLPHVVFYADGSCSPFRAQLRSGGPARRMSFDPWTCAEFESEARP